MFIYCKKFVKIINIEMQSFSIINQFRFQSMMYRNDKSFEKLYLHKNFRRWRFNKIPCLLFTSFNISIKRLTNKIIYFKTYLYRYESIFKKLWNLLIKNILPVTKIYGNLWLNPLGDPCEQSAPVKILQFVNRLTRVKSNTICARAQSQNFCKTT